MKNMNTPNAELEVLAASRAITLILQNFGALTDLPLELAKVVWVTSYRASVIWSKVESGGGAIALTKSMLVGGGHDAREFEERTSQIKFLNRIVPMLRAANPKDKKSDTQLVVDILKWEILDASDMSYIRRLIARKFAKVDAMYDQSLPQELM